MKNCAKVLLALGVLMSSVAHAELAPLTQDTFVSGYPDQRNINKGAATVLKAVGWGPRRSFVRFDLSAFGGTVTSAAMTFNVERVGVAGNVGFHQVLGPAWDENSLTFDTQPLFDPSAADSVLVTTTGSVSLDITAIAQAWVDDPSSNHGLALLTSANVQFWSKDGGLGATLDVATDGSPPAPPVGAELSISGVFVDLDNDMLFIEGANFNNGTTPVVTLGEFPELNQPIAALDTMIQVDLPAGILDGDYLLTISTGPTDGQTTTYDLTIDGGLTEAEVDGFVANNGFSVGPHAVDTNTQLTEAQVDAFVLNNGFTTEPHYTDADAIAAVGPHTTAGLISFAIQNTQGGTDALASNTTGEGNTAIGSLALTSNIDGDSNTAIGVNALRKNVSGTANTAIGLQALFSNNDAVRNVAFGHQTLRDITIGFRNSAFGSGALRALNSGDHNIAVGDSAGGNLIMGSDNITIGNRGVAGESATIRIGQMTAEIFGSDPHSRAFIAGIRGVTTGNVDAVNVVIDSNGQLGTVSSSRRYKEDITEMAMASEPLLNLRPVTFRYKEPYDNGEKPIQYGLIAEEVAEQFPDLVVFDEEGQAETVKYQLLSVLLLNELKKQQAELQNQQQLNQHQEVLLTELQIQSQEITTLKAQLAELQGLRDLLVVLMNERPALVSMEQ